ncbi:SDR family oxidoreductase [Alkalihalophilus lindianensis]|uniref:SDR family oxidoreductase n=1 Tax=Alkalihalophilus lindianensis TaxID=1630542 RepID=A0ABU3X8B7_9BACI|nr:SDR family oxidoreductase [Alkalihalophilus lindianensis]MDV2684132.1 SDR family oxidoreductase [Alkalihalophilus lindianensis]
MDLHNVWECGRDGATSGIGRAAVHRFVKEGDHVISGGRSQTKGMQLFQESDSNGYIGCVDFFQADIANETEVIQFYKELSMTFSSIDVLVNNGEIAPPAAGELERITEDEWHKLFNTNVEATLWMMKHGIKHMDRKKGASIINLAATTGVTTHLPTLAAYSASKKSSTCVINKIIS